MMKTLRLHLLVTAALLLLLNGRDVSGAMLYLEDFSSDIGVSSRDGEMSVIHDGGNQWMTGSFAAQGFPTPQTDAFVVDSAPFTGDYTGAGLTQIRFQMFAVNVLPSDLFIRIIDGTNTFSYQFNPIAGMFNNWQTFTVDLAWSYGWSGAGESAFNTALTSVDQIEIQLTRNGGAAQEYRFDNLQTLDTPLDPGGGGGGAVPEPTTFSLFLVSAGVVFFIRRRLHA